MGTLLGFTATPNLFETIDTPNGTDPLALEPDDTLTLTSSDNTVSITGDAATRTVDFKATSAVGTVLPYPFIANGNTADKWLGTYEASHFSNENPLVLPQDSELKGMLFVNLDDSVDSNIEIYCNGTLCKTFEVRNKRFSYVVGISPPVTMLQGDRISVFMEKFTGGTGDQTAQDPSVTLLMKISNEAGADGGQENGVT